jgi:hypothetical protein
MSIGARSSAAQEVPMQQAICTAIPELDDFDPTEIDDNPILNPSSK